MATSTAAYLSIVGLTIQVIGVACIALLFQLFKRAAQRSYLSLWSMAWLAMLAALVSLRVWQTWTKTLGSLRIVYFLGEYLFVILLAAGFDSYPERPRPLRIPHWIWPLALLWSVLLSRLSSDFSTPFAVHAFVFAALLGYVLRRITRIALLRTHRWALALVLVGLGLLALDFFANGVLLLVVPIPTQLMAIGYSAYQSIIDLFIEVLVAFGLIAVAAVDLRVTLERARANLQGERDRFELIARIAADIHQETDCDAMLQRAADAIHDVLKYPSVDIPLVDPADPGVLVLRACGGYYKSKLKGDNRIPIEQGIMGAAVRESATQLVNDVGTDPRFLHLPGMAPTQAELAIPIHLGDRILGVLNIENDRTFDNLDRRSLEVIADYLAVAINNAQLFEKAGYAAVLSERHRLACELHDNVTQLLSSISLLSQTVASTWQRSPVEGERRAIRLHQLAQAACAEMRMLLQQLAPVESIAEQNGSQRHRSMIGLEFLREHALPAALTQLLAVVIPDGLAVKLGFSAYVPQELAHETAFYLVCQEAVSNCLRHADAKWLRITAGVTASHAVVRIIDDGRGLPTEFRPGIGLGSMRSRMESLRGQLRVSPIRPRGTLIEARLPRADRHVVANA